MAAATFRKRFDLRIRLISTTLLLGLCVLSWPLDLFGEGVKAFVAPEQKSSGPVITYQTGQLTIDARDSSLSDILRAVCKQTGAVIDLPPEANRRVTRQIGPAPIGELLDSLLKDSGLNYVILSTGDPNAPVRVILLSKGGDSAALPPMQVSTVVVPHPAEIQRAAGNDPRRIIEEERQMSRERREIIRQTIDQRLKEQEELQ